MSVFFKVERIYMFWKSALIVLVLPEFEHQKLTPVDYLCFISAYIYTVYMVIFCLYQSNRTENGLEM